MLSRDDRYNLIKPMLQSGQLKSLNDIFRYVPKTVVATDLGKQNKRFNRLMHKVRDFTLGELVALANLCHLEISEILRLAEVEFVNQSRKSTMTHKQNTQTNSS